MDRKAVSCVSGVDEEDEILALLDGDRDLYLALMTDLEDALLQDMLQEEEEETRQRHLYELESWEEQLTAEEREERLEYAVYEARKRALELEHLPLARDEDPQNCSMQVLFNEDSCDSAGSCVAMEAGAVGGLDDEEDSNLRADSGGGAVDYLVCPVCKRQCMDLRRRANLAECRCGTSLHIGRKRHLAAQTAAGRPAAVSTAGTAWLSIEEIKTIISDSMETHRLACPVLLGAPLTIDFVEFRLERGQDAWSAAGHDDHPYLYYHCSHCSHSGYVV